MGLAFNRRDRKKRKTPRNKEVVRIRSDTRQAERTDQDTDGFLQRLARDKGPGTRVGAGRTQHSPGRPLDDGGEPGAPEAPKHLPGPVPPDSPASS